MFDFSSILNARLDILSTNGIIGIVLVIVFLSLFLNTRLALWVAWGIPASFLGMFVIAYLLGVTINMISLFGMIMVIGILVDDGVVIGENIYHHFEKGKSPRQASIDGATEVLPAIFTSVSTTIVAFFPLLLLQGHMSMMNEMAVVVIACLAMSLFEGTFVLPGHLSHKAVLDTKKEIGFFKRFRNLIDRGLFWFRDRVYLKVLKLVLKYKWISLSFLVSCILVTAGLLAGGKIGITFFPAMEDDSFTIDLALKPGTSTEVTKSYLYYLEKTCRDVSKQMTNEYEEDEEIIKYLELRTGSSFSGAESGTHAGQITVMLKDIENVTWSVSEVKRRIAKKVGSIKEAVKFAVGASNRWGAPVSISLLSRNEEQLTEATDWLKLKLGEISELYNINDNNRLGSQEIRIKLKEKAYVLGFTQQSLMNQVRQAFFGGQAQRLVDGKDEVRVYVRYSKEDRVNIGQLEKLKIQTAQGTFPLYSLVDFTIDRSPVVISRYNGRREITVDAFQKDPSKPVNPIIQDVNNTILSQIKTKFPEVDFVYRGQMQSSQEEGAHLLHGFLIAFIIMVLIIMASFKSFYQGILILLVIPAGWISAIWGHGIEGYPLSMLSAFGIVALSGTIINDAVVYLSKFNQCLKEGMGLIDSLLESARSRFRPILLTSLTTVVGLYPLILDASIQARFLIPMAISLAYGIFIGTIFIIFLFPVIVLCGNSVKYRFRKLFYKGNIERLDVEPVIVHKKHKLESID
jgi:multidrug efflux pump subunit AcrB